MAKNLIPEVCKLFGVEVGEEFKIANYTANFRFSESTLECNVSGEWSGGWPHLLSSLLQGKTEIIKLPWQPKDGDAYYSVTFSCEDDKLHIAKRRWVEGYIDCLAFLKADWVFRTREEAEAALPKVAEELGVEYES